MHTAAHSKMHITHFNAVLLLFHYIVLPHSKIPIVVEVTNNVKEILKSFDFFLKELIGLLAESLTN